MGFLLKQEIATAYAMTPYSAVIAYAKDNQINENVTFLIKDEALPKGLMFDDHTGEISGTINDASLPKTSFRVELVGTQEFVMCTIMIANGPAPKLSIVALPKLLKVTKNAFYAIKIPVDGGIGQMTYSCHGLPKGILCHEKVGVIYGQPIAFGGDTTVTISATDSANNLATAMIIMRMVQDDVERC